MMKIELEGNDEKAGKKIAVSPRDLENRTSEEKHAILFRINRDHVSSVDRTAVYVTLFKTKRAGLVRKSSIFWFRIYSEERL